MPTSAKFLFTTEDGSHILDIDIKCAWYAAILSILIKLDGKEIEKKQVKALSDVLQLNGKYLINLKTRIGELEVSGLQNAKKKIVVQPDVVLAECTSNANFVFVIDGQNIPIGQHIKIVEPMGTVSAPPIVNAAQPQVVVNVQPQSNSAVAPSLPPHCSQCGASLHMNSVKWTGPLSAACPTCGSAIQVVWNKIG